MNSIKMCQTQLDSARRKALAALHEAQSELNHIRKMLESGDADHICGRYGSEMQRLHEALGAYDVAKIMMTSLDIESGGK